MHISRFSHLRLAATACALLATAACDENAEPLAADRASDAGAGGAGGGAADSGGGASAGGASVEADGGAGSAGDVGAVVEPDAGGSTGEDAAVAGPSACGLDESTEGRGVCVHAGPRDCAAVLRDAAGRCRPSLDACPAGQLPSLRSGCVPVGLSACAPEFVNAETGRCEPRAALCPAGTRPRGVLGCVPVEATPEACGPAPFGDFPMDDRPNLFVNPEAAPGGDGSQEAPFQTIGAAQAAAQDAWRIVLAGGTYAEPIVFRNGEYNRVIWGRCPQLVRITGYADGPDLPDEGWPAPRATVLVHGVRNIEIARVTVVSERIGVRVSTSVFTKLDDVVIERFGEAGVRVMAGGQVMIRGLSYLGGPQSGERDDSEVFGPVVVGTGGYASVEDSTIIGAHTGLKALGQGSRLRVARTLVESSRIQHPDSSSLAVRAGVLEVEESAVVGATVSVSGSEDARMTLHRNWFGDNVAVESEVNQSAAWGLKVDLGTQAEAAGNVFARTGGAAVYVSAEGSFAALSENLYSDTQATDAHDGAGLRVRNKASAFSEGDVFSGCRHAAIDLENEHAEVPSRVALERAIVLDTQPDADGRWGLGAWVQQYCELDVLDSVFAGNHEFGLLAVLPVTRLSLRHSTVADTSAPPRGPHGVGVGLLLGAVGVLDHVRLEGNTSAGLVAGDIGVEPTRLTSSLVADTHADSPAAAGEMADGVVALADALVDIEGSAIEHIPRAGLAYTSAGGTIRNTRVTDAAQGLVLQGAEPAAVDYSDPGNAVAPVVTDGALDLPTAASLLPP